MRTGMMWMAVLATSALVGCGESGEPEASRELPAPDVADAGSNAASEPASLVRFGSESVPAKASGTYRLASYNVENLFDGEDDPTLAGDFDDMDDVKPEGELEAVAQAIRDLDADVLALQEIESEAALTWFRDTYLQGLGYEFIASVDVGDARGIECGVLSRFPLRDAEVWIGEELDMVHPEDASDSRVTPGETVLFRRSPMRVTVDVPTASGGTEALVLFNVHHKSGWRNTYWRIAEAMKVSDLYADDVESGAMVVVLGDYNARLTDSGPADVYRQRGLSDVRTVAGGNLDGNLGVTHESGRAIDHVFVSPTLGERLVAGSVTVLGTDARPENDDWRNTPKPEGYASDHYPVMVDIRQGE